MSSRSKPSLTGGAYIPPAKLKMLQAAITDKTSVEFQRLAWEALKKSINGLVNKINIPNIAMIVRELFKENIVRGRGILVRSIMQAQLFSPTFTNVYASLIAIINMKFPQIGELLLKRLILQFKMSYKQNKKEQCLSTCKFIAHLINQNVAHEILSLQVLTLLLENPTNHSVEVAIGLLKDCGKKLSMESPQSLHAIFETLRQVLNQQTSEVDDKRIQYMIEVMFAVRKDGFKDYPIVLKELDLVEEEEQYTHMMSIDDEFDAENALNIFKFDESYEETEEKYKILKKEILDETDSEDESGSDESGSSETDSDEEDEAEEKKEEVSGMIVDETETNLVSLRRTIYLTIQSSLDFQECAHKLLRMNIKENQRIELCQMILDACAQQRTYERFFGLLGQRFCELKKEYVECFEEIFKQQYETCHRLETVKLRNVSRFLSHLLYTDSISWGVLDCVHLNEEETTSSSRVYLKNLLLDLTEHMGIIKSRERFNDPTLQEFFQGLFPRDNPRNTRFAINFFTSIGLGPLTDELREHLKIAPKLMEPVVLQDEEESEKEEKKSKKSKKKKSKKSKKQKKSKKHSSSSSNSASEDSDKDDEKAEEKLRERLKQLQAEEKEASMRKKLVDNLSKLDSKRHKYSDDSDDSETERRKRTERRTERDGRDSYKNGRDDDKGYRDRERQMDSRSPGDRTTENKRHRSRSDERRNKRKSYADDHYSTSRDRRHSRERSSRHNNRSRSRS